MSKKLILEKNIDIEPKYINENILQTIEEQFNKNNECTLKDGYIKSKKIISIKSNPITKIYNKISFTVRYIAETLKPEKGMKLKAVINNIFPSGVLMEYEKIKIFVPLKNIEKINMSINKNIIEHKKDKDTKFTMGDTVKIVIQDIRFETKNFICIAQIELV